MHQRFKLQMKQCVSIVLEQELQGDFQKFHTLSKSLNHSVS
jgi:hypothetical protein